MTLRLTLISTEVEDFILELKIDANASFADLHRLILSHCRYKEAEGQRFFICDENWKPTQRILLGDEENVNIDEDVFLMADTDLGEFLEDEGQRIAYRFDPENRRMFLIELTETSFGDPVPASGILTRKHGNPPSQFEFEDSLQSTETNSPSETTAPHLRGEAEHELAEEFYGEDGFEEEDLDLEGFDILE